MLNNICFSEYSTESKPFYNVLFCLYYHNDHHGNIIGPKKCQSIKPVIPPLRLAITNVTLCTAGTHLKVKYKNTVPAIASIILIVHGYIPNKVHILYSSVSRYACPLINCIVKTPPSS